MVLDFKDYYKGIDLDILNYLTISTTFSIIYLSSEFYLLYNLSPIKDAYILFFFIRIQNCVASCFQAITSIHAVDWIERSKCNRGEVNRVTVWIQLPVLTHGKRNSRYYVQECSIVAFKQANSGDRFETKEGICIINTRDRKFRTGFKRW